MDALRSLDGPTRAALRAHVARIKHDLGKYVAFQVRWVGEQASLEDRRAALAADLLATRRGPEGNRDALDLWTEVRRGLVGEEALENGARVALGGDPAVHAIDAAMIRIGEVLASLRDGGAGEEEVRRGTEAALIVAEACRELHRRVHEVT